MAIGCHGVSPSFLAYLLARSLPATLDFFLRASRSYPTSCGFTENLTESFSVSYAATSYSSSTRNSSTLLMMYVASAKSASVLSLAFICLNCFNGQSYPLHVSYKVRYSRNHYAPI